MLSVSSVPPVMAVAGATAASRAPKPTIVAPKERTRLRMALSPEEQWWK
jgi:hypothetical protein